MANTTKPEEKTRNDYFMVNKFLLGMTDLTTAVIFSDLQSKERYFKDKKQLNSEGFFFNTQDNIERDTSVKRNKQREGLFILEELGLLSITRETYPRRNYYKIQDKNWLDFISTPEDKVLDLRMKIDQIKHTFLTEKATKHKGNQQGDITPLSSCRNIDNNGVNMNNNEVNMNNNGVNMNNNGVNMNNNEVNMNNNGVNMNNNGVNMNNNGVNMNNNGVNMNNNGVNMNNNEVNTPHQLSKNTPSVVHIDRTNKNKDNKNKDNKNKLNENKPDNTKLDKNKLKENKLEKSNEFFINENPLDGFAETDKPILSDCPQPEEKVNGTSYPEDKTTVSSCSGEIDRTPDIQDTESPQSSEDKGTLPKIKLADQVVNGEVPYNPGTDPYIAPGRIGSLYNPLTDPDREKEKVYIEPDGWVDMPYPEGDITDPDVRDSEPFLRVMYHNFYYGDTEAIEVAVDRALKQAKARREREAEAKAKKAAEDALTPEQKAERAKAEERAYQERRRKAGWSWTDENGNYQFPEGSIVGPPIIAGVPDAPKDDVDDTVVDITLAGRSRALFSALSDAPDEMDDVSILDAVNGKLVELSNIERAIWKDKGITMAYSPAFSTFRSVDTKVFRTMIEYINELRAGSFILNHEFGEYKSRYKDAAYLYRGRSCKQVLEILFAMLHKYIIYRAETPFELRRTNKMSISDFILNDAVSHSSTIPSYLLSMGIQEEKVYVDTPSRIKSIRERISAFGDEDIKGETAIDAMFPNIKMYEWTEADKLGLYQSIYDYLNFWKMNEAKFNPNNRVGLLFRAARHWRNNADFYDIQKCKRLPSLKSEMMQKLFKQYLDDLEK